MASSSSSWEEEIIKQRQKTKKKKHRNNYKDDDDDDKKDNRSINNSRKRGRQQQQQDDVNEEEKEKEDCINDVVTEDAHPMKKNKKKHKKKHKKVDDGNNTKDDPPKAVVDDDRREILSTTTIIATTVAGPPPPTTTLTDNENLISDRKKEKKSKKDKKKTKKDKKNDKKKKKKLDLEHDDPLSEQEAGASSNNNNHNNNDDDDPNHNNNNNNNNNNKRQRDEQLMRQQQEAESRALLTSTTSISETGIFGNGSGRVVASSAIEFYDPTIKEKVKKMKRNNNNNNSDDKNKNDNNNNMGTTTTTTKTTTTDTESLTSKDKTTSAVLPAQQKHHHNLTLLLFYQYVEPVWDESTYDYMLSTLQGIGTDLMLTGRMRVAREGLNCTLTGSNESIVEYCQTLRSLRPKDFTMTEFKLTTDLPVAQKFPNLKVFPVVELVHYGLEGDKAPPISMYHGTHLEPKDYHKKLAEPNTVIIDVRNHYEAAIGRFVPPTTTVGDANKSNCNTNDDGCGHPPLQPPPPKWLDPKMRKSTEFPAYLDRPETREEMKGKQVLMYCTGGIRCERASALLKYKMETDPEIKALNIQGVYQLQGGIDKYFKEFPDGGYWQGKNYVFDKRFAHAPPKIDGELHGRTIGATAQEKEDEEDDTARPTTSEHEGNGSRRLQSSSLQVLGKCEACSKPWDMYRGKRRCPTCGVPSLICKDCAIADKEGRKRLGKNVRCDLCVEQKIFSKHDLRERDEKEIQQYEAKMAAKGLLQPNRNIWNASSGGCTPASSQHGTPPHTNPNGVTRLFLKNMCRKNMDETSLMEALPGITHIVWRLDRATGNFLGSGWVEMATPSDAARAVAQDGKLRVFGRPLGIAYQAPDGKDSWPPPNSAVIR